MNWSPARRLSQLCALLGANLYLGYFKTKQLYQGRFKSVCVPFLNCHACPSALMTCPVGALQHFMTIHRFPFSVAGWLAAVGIVVGALPCGWLCPFGLLQDLMYKIKSVKIRILPQLTVMRYFVLAFLVALIPLMTRATWFCKLCPMGTLQAGLPWAIWNPTIPVYNEPAVTLSDLGTVFTIKILLLIACLVLFVVAKRPFCRVVCPLGAIFGLFNRYSLLRLKAGPGTSNACASCADECPVDLNVCEDPNASTCIRCMQCLKCENVRLSIVGLEGNDASQPERKEPVHQDESV